MSDTYNGVEYDVTTVKLSRGRKEFELYVGNELVITASQLEKKGVSFEDIPNWTVALETFARAYIDYESVNKSVESVKYHYPSD